MQTLCAFVDFHEGQGGRGNFGNRCQIVYLILVRRQVVAPMVLNGSHMQVGHEQSVFQHHQLGRWIDFARQTLTQQGV